jgi:hypothetical protein
VILWHHYSAEVTFVLDVAIANLRLDNKPRNIPAVRGSVMPNRIFVIQSIPPSTKMIPPPTRSITKVKIPHPIIVGLYDAQ